MKVCVYTNHSIIPLAGVSMVPLLWCQGNCSPSDLDRNYPWSSRIHQDLCWRDTQDKLFGTVLPRVYLKGPQQRAVVLVQLPPVVYGVVRTASIRVVSLRCLGYSSAQGKTTGRVQHLPEGVELHQPSWSLIIYRDMNIRRNACIKNLQ